MEKNAAQSFKSRCKTQSSITRIEKLCSKYATAKRASKRVAKRSVSKKRRVKKKTAAFVGGRSRGITKNAPWGCVPGRLKRVLDQVSRKYGRVIVNSTNRSRSRNRMVGGKKRSYHIGCRAVDFRVAGSNKGLSRFLRNHPSVGGFKR